MVKIVLASKSPRRQELLSNIGVDFTVFTQDVDENVDRSFSPRKTVEILAERRCLASVKKLSPGSVVISADTVVSADGKIFGKPRDKQDAYNMLRSLSGQWHEVLTGIAVSDGEKTVVESEVSKVCFRPLTDDEIDNFNYHIFYNLMLRIKWIDYPELQKKTKSKKKVGV